MCDIFSVQKLFAPINAATGDVDVATAEPTSQDVKPRV
jgi:hypothetical protein